jgi:AraC-like DNA-binding protein
MLASGDNSSYSTCFKSWRVLVSALPSVVVDSLRFIERNCLRRPTLGEVARAVQSSPSYVTSALTQATGRNAVEWIISGRMAEAPATRFL